jgi:hypothetical protein
MQPELDGDTSAAKNGPPSRKVFMPTRVARWFICIQKYQFGLVLDGLGMEHVGICDGHFGYISAIWSKYFMAIW